MTKRRKKKEEDQERFEVTVWGLEGDIIKKLWEATWEEAEEIRKDYEDEPWKTVVVEPLYGC